MYYFLSRDNLLDNRRLIGGVVFWEKRFKGFLHALTPSRSEGPVFPGGRTKKDIKDRRNKKNVKHLVSISYLRTYVYPVVDKYRHYKQ